MAPGTTPKTIVMVFGVFDILHPGHLAFLEEARTHGDELVVVVTPDEKAAAEKGRRPLFRTEERLAMLRALRVVDRAVAGDAGTEWTVVVRERPDVICAGHDQRTDHPGFLAQLARLQKTPAVRRMAAHHPDTHKSSRIRPFVERMR